MWLTDAVIDGRDLLTLLVILAVAHFAAPTLDRWAARYQAWRAARHAARAAAEARVVDDLTRIGAHHRNTRTRRLS